MKLELYMQNSADGKVFNLTEVASTISVTKSIDGTAGKLTCILYKDNYNILEIENGSRISFQVDDKGIFFGYIFKIGFDADGNYKITAYDQLRYLKNSDIYSFKNMTASDIFKKICTDYDLKYSIEIATNYVPEAYSFVNKSLYTMIKRGMDLASINDKRRYFIIDNFGTLTWTDLKKEGEEKSIILGDKSLITSFTYEKSIDSDTYNSVKLYKNDKNNPNVPTWTLYDTNNIKKWGILQYMAQVDDNLNEAQIKQRVEQLLLTLNDETKTLKLEGEGILECEAGQRIKFQIEKQNINQWMWIITSTHKFSKYEHTMDLEVMV